MTVRQRQKFVVWFRDAVALCDWKSLSFFNKHELHSREIWFIEFYDGGALPQGCERYDS